MKRREFLTGLAAVLATPLLTSCSSEESRDKKAMYVVELWTDSNPEDFANSVAIRLFASQLVEHAEYKGLYLLPQPLAAKLPSGLNVEVTCERVATGHLNVGISHDGTLVSAGKYIGPFTIRVFPPGHQSYILDIKDVDAVATGA